MPDEAMGHVTGQVVEHSRVLDATSSEPWIQQVTRICGELRALPWDTLDRSKFEILFRCANEKAATRLMRKFGASGKPLTITRARLLEALADYGTDEDAAAELERRKGFSERFKAIRQQFIEQPPVPVAAPAKVTGTKPSHIATVVALEPGRLTVEFRTVEELAKKLLLVAMAIGNEPDAFHPPAEPTP